MTVQDELERQRRATQAKARGLQEWQVEAMRATPDSLIGDIVRDSYRGPSQRSSIIPSQPEPERPASGGTVEVKAVPGLNYVDAIAESFDRRERLEALIKERALVREMIDQKTDAAEDKPKQPKRREEEK